MSYDNNLQSVNEHFAGQKDWWSKKQCNTCKKNPNWYYCGEYLGALDVHTGEHYEDIFEKINDLVSTLSSITTVTLNNESFLGIDCGNEENITVEYENGVDVEGVTTSGNIIVVPDTNLIVNINNFEIVNQNITEDTTINIIL